MRLLKISAITFPFLALTGIAFAQPAQTSGGWAGCCGALRWLVRAVRRLLERGLCGFWGYGLRVDWLPKRPRNRYVAVMRGVTWLVLQAGPKADSGFFRVRLYETIPVRWR